MFFLRFRTSVLKFYDMGLFALGQVFVCFRTSNLKFKGKFFKF